MTAPPMALWAQLYPVVLPPILLPGGTIGCPVTGSWWANVNSLLPAENHLSAM